MAIYIPAAAQEQSAKSLEVHAAIGNLDFAVDRMQNLVATLNERLQPVLRRPEDVEGTKCDRAEFGAPLAEGIQRRVDHVEKFNSALSDLINRLEV